MHPLKLSHCSLTISFFQFNRPSIFWHATVRGACWYILSLFVYNVQTDYTTCLNIDILNDFWMFSHLNKLHALFYYFIIVYKCLASFIYNVNKVRHGLKETLWSCIICLNIWSHNSNGCLFTVVNTVWVIMSSNKVTHTLTHAHAHQDSNVEPFCSVFQWIQCIATRETIYNINIDDPFWKSPSHYMAGNRGRDMSEEYMHI